MTQFAFVFPGQGSQTVGMLSDLNTVYSDIKSTFDEASAVLNYDLWALTKYGPVEELNKTWQTQPALLAGSVAIWRIWKAKNGKIPLLMAGHSLGEYSALVCAGVLSFSDAISLVEKRGRFMQDVIPEGTSTVLAVIGLDDIIVNKICEDITMNEQIVSPINYNAFDQIVIAGHKKAVELAGEACKLAGAKRVLKLPISVPSHCILMKPAAEKLATELKKISFSIPKIPVVNNVDVQCEMEPRVIRNALVRQLYSPVQWTKIVKYITSKNIECIYEIGPGKVLTNLIKRTVNSITVLAINKLDVLSSVLLK